MVEPPVLPFTEGRIREARAALGERIVQTPVVQLDGPAIRQRWPAGELFLKLELFQRAGTFKPRGALLVMLDLAEDALRRGVTAVSAGNHAMAVGYAASVLGTSAKVVMPKNANPARVAGCRAYGAEIVLCENVHAAFAEVERIVADEGRTFVHPFEGPLTALGNATLGLELLEQVDDLDCVVVPIGGGGLCAGVAAAVKAVRPSCRVYGVEPRGADTMHRSFAAGSPQNIERVRTIADSLGAPHAAPYSFELCRDHVDELVLVDDDGLREAMHLLFTAGKLAVEPAGAATTAALLGPLRDRVAGKRVAAIVCGSNIDPESFAAILRGSGPMLD
jgi:threonine dehydratase